MWTSRRRRKRVVVLFVLLVVVEVFVIRSFTVAGAQEFCRSACGNITNIAFPFRLKGDPPNCGDQRYELACENNRTVLNLLHWLDSPKKFYVQAITHQNYTIRLVDPGLVQDHCSPFPIHSVSRYTPYNLMGPFVFIDYDYYLYYSYHTITFINCPVPANSCQFVSTPFCGNNSNASSFSPPPLKSYVAWGDMTEASDVENSCRIGPASLSSLMSAVGFDGTISFPDIRDALVYGFELAWYRVYCGECLATGGECYVQYGDDPLRVVCDKNCDLLNRNYVRQLLQKQTSVHHTLQCLHFWIGFFLRENYHSICKSIGIILAVRFSCGIPLLIVLLVYQMRRRRMSMYDCIEDFLQSHNNLMPLRYSYSEIKRMTHGFKDKLGEGGYGTVFKGKLRSGPLVAVKMMGKSKATGQEFINEVATIGRIHHVNVVQLVGFCAQGSKRALVYDFMPNGSLEKYIFPQEEGNVSLSCEKMHEICLGVAHGIEYLHRGCDMKILHFDIKPHNILLDENFIPKVSDFGLAKLYPVDDSIVSLTAARGTMGYMAPELFYKNIGSVSYKADVYSFGMLLMEMAGRRKNLNLFADHSSQIYFPSWVYDQFNEGNDILELIGATTDEEKNMIKKMIIVALWCIQMNPTDRPSMGRVAEMLEGDVGLLQMPPKPFLSPQEMPATKAQAGTITTAAELSTQAHSNFVDSISFDISEN